MVRGARRKDALGGSQGGYAGFPRAARLCGRLDGRDLGDHRGRPKRYCSAVSLFDGARRRVMGRMEAKGKVDRKTGEVRRAPKVTTEMMHESFPRENSELRAAGVAQSP